MWRKFMAQSYEGLFDHVVAEGSAYQKSYKVDRRLAQYREPPWATNKVDTKKKLLP